MGIKRGNFVLVCDKTGCDNYIDLETTDFEEAKAEAREAKDVNGWSTVQIGSHFSDICDLHS